MFKRLFRGKLGIAGLGVFVLVIGGIVFASANRKEAHAIIEVTQGEIREEVVITGKTTPVRKIDLSFERAGKVARARKDVGDRVEAGRVIAELNSNELLAQLGQANAQIDIQKAKLDELARGTRQEDLDVTKAGLAKAEQSLANEYGNVIQILNDAYSKTDDAVRNQLSPLFSNADNPNPQLTFAASDAQAQIDAQSGRVAVGNELVAWRNELKNMEPFADAATLEDAIEKTQSRLSIILSFVNRTMDAVTTSPSGSAGAYKTNVTAARSAINSSIANVNANEQGIASQKSVVEEARSKLILQLAGGTEEELRAQTAAVAEAEANASLIKAQIEETVLRSPVAGIVTRQDAKVGEVVPAHTAIASVISADAFEIDVNVSESDIGKIKLGNPVSITFDAFPAVVFRGAVLKIDPAETIIDGVVNFKTVVELAKPASPKLQRGEPDERLKSGLTANLAIETLKKTDALILPQAAIIEKKEGAFVKKYKNGSFIESPVTLGIRDKNGNVEIVSGVAEGERVANIGLKNPSQK